jgi:hypothetical protein
METVTDILAIPAELLIGAIAVLDSLPDFIRAMLAALVLALLLRYFEVRIPPSEVQYGQSFRKSALISLLLIPLFVYFFPASRMVVFVEELPLPAPSDHWLWRSLFAAWFAGFILTLVQFARAQLQTRGEVAGLPGIEDEKLVARLAHWQRRLGMSREIMLVQYSGEQPRQFMTKTKIGIPTAALHWPGSVQDIVLIHALCHLQKRHARWQLIAQFVSALYWPITWIQTLHADLLEDFERATDALADSCYQDHLGYARALGQLEQRTKAPGQVAADNETGKLPRALTGYLARIRRLLQPAAEPHWNLEALLADRREAVKPLWRDPYDKVVLFVGQAVFLAFLLTGVTLEERPPELDRNYELPFAVLWKEHFHRNLELQDKTVR